MVRAGDGWAELALGSDPAIFFAVHRLEFERELEDDTRGRFHVLNLVEGDRSTSPGTHSRTVRRSSFPPRSGATCSAAVRPRS